MGGSAAQSPAPPPPRAANGLRASDAERDEAAARLKDEFVAGRLSHETFMHRMSVVLSARQQAELPPLLADLPAASDTPEVSGTPAVAAGSRAVAAWARGAWRRLAAGQQAVKQAVQGTVREPVPRRGMTVGMIAAGGRHQPLALQFPRGSGSEFSIGRDAGCDLAIPDMSVSRRHAILERVADGWLLTDLESTNGTRVNGWRIRGKVKVMAGDLVSFGNAEAVFTRSDVPPELPA